MSRIRHRVVVVGNTALVDREHLFGFSPVVHLPTMSHVGWHWRRQPEFDTGAPMHAVAAAREVLAQVDARDRPSNRFITIAVRRAELDGVHAAAQHGTGAPVRVNVALRSADFGGADVVETGSEPAGTPASTVAAISATVQTLHESGLGVWLFDDDLSAALRVLATGSSIDRLVIPAPTSDDGERSTKADLVVRRGLVEMARSLGTPTMMTRIDDDSSLLAARRCGVDLGSGQRLGGSLATPAVVHLSKPVPYDAVQHPVDELERLRAVYDAQVLDTPPEDLFDDLTRQAATAFDVPISLVSIVDADRQWFKSRHGLDVSETSREVAFCAHAICEANVMVVPDAMYDPRFARNPLVTGEHGFRFYAGAQIRTSDGFSLGTLCVIDREPRHPSQEQIQVLERLAHMASIALELRSHHHRAAHVEPHMNDDRAGRPRR